jgi:hypothetical protein
MTISYAGCINSKKCLKNGISFSQRIYREKNPLELVKFSRIPIGMHKHSTNIVIISEIIVSFVVGKYLIHIQSKNKFINTYKI